MPLSIEVPERLRRLEGRAAIIAATDWWPEQPVRLGSFERDLSDRDWFVDVCLIRKDGEADMQFVPLADVRVSF